MVDVGDNTEVPEPLYRNLRYALLEIRLDLTFLGEGAARGMEASRPV